MTAKNGVVGSSRKSVLIVIVAVLGFMFAIFAETALKQKSELLHTQLDELTVAAALARTTSRRPIESDAFDQAWDAIAQGNTMQMTYAAGNAVDNKLVFESAKSAASMFDNEIAEAIAAYQTELRKAAIRSQMASRPGMMGRFVVPSVGIDVALIVPDNPYEKKITQSIVDAIDSAMICADCMGAPYVIADHRNQTFGNLTSIVPGTKAYIETGDDSTTIELVCTAVIDGYNYDVLIRESGEGIAGLATYVCYTCHYDYAQTRRVRFVGWEPC